MSVTFSASIVAYAPDAEMLANTIRSLAAAAAAANREGILREARLWLVDNGPRRDSAAQLTGLLEKIPEAAGLAPSILTGHGNVGYGQGHNLGIKASVSDYHLVLNPDVILAENAIGEAIRFMLGHPYVVLLAPEVRDQHGELQFLCKRYPSVLDLILRGFAPEALKHAFRDRLERYELRDRLGAKPLLDIQIASGSFMFCQRAVLVEIGGFAEQFFMYFEDFDLSLRLARKGRLAYVPSAKVVHLGGGVAKKGWRHIFMFARSAATFFRIHGWKWL